MLKPSACLRRLDDTFDVQEGVRSLRKDVMYGNRKNIVRVGKISTLGNFENLWLKVIPLHLLAPAVSDSRPSPALPQPQLVLALHVYRL